MKSIVYEDDHIKVIGQIGTRLDRGVISFGHAKTRDEGDNFWGSNFFAKRGIAAVGFIDKWSHWFVPEYTHKGIEAAKQFLYHLPFTVAYGFSKGGYAVIRNADQIKADMTICLSPQISIAPHDVGHFDRRFIARYDQNIHGDMMLPRKKLPPNCIVGYDPRHVVDRRHIQHILPDRHEAVLYVPFSGHASITTLTECSAVEPMITGTQALEASRESRNLVRTKRRSSVSYLRAIATVFKHRNRRDLSIYFLEKARNIDPLNLDIAIYLATTYIEMRYNEKTINIISEIEKDIQNNDANLIKIANLYRKCGLSMKAKEIIEGYLSSTRPRGDALLLLANCLIDMRSSDALQALQRAEDKALRSASFYNQLAQSYGRLREFSRMLEILRRATLIEPSNPAAARARLRALEQHGSREDIAVATADLRDNDVLPPAIQADLQRLALLRQSTDPILSSP